MLKVGTTVYHKSLNANGTIIEIDDNKQRDKYKVKFLWGKYAAGSIRHGDYTRIGKNTLWQWCEEANLHEIGQHPDERLPPTQLNKVTTFGGRSLDKLLRSMIQFPRRRLNDGSNIILNYGTWQHVQRTHPRILVLNRQLITNKYEQMKILGEDLTSHSTRSVPPDLSNYIVKPMMSIGGRGICRATEQGHLGMSQYYQKLFPKVREFRVHCFLWLDNEVPLIQEKKIADTTQLCWNKKQGGQFYYPYQEGILDESSEISKADKGIMKKMAIEALRKLRYDFGGIDFGMDAMGKFKIFEVNSRMGLREKSFANYIPTMWALKTLNINAYKNKRGW